MKLILSLTAIILSVLCCNSCYSSDTFTLENEYLSRTISIEDGVLRTTSIVNKLSGDTLRPSACMEFKVRISEGTDKVAGDIVLSAKDFKVKTVNHSSTHGSTQLVVSLENTIHELMVDVHYQLESEDSYARKYLSITSQKVITLERVDVEAITSEGAFQPYTLKLITARGHAQWKPGLGQPLHDTQSATFWGIEFPAASNEVLEQELNCGYLWGKQLEPGQSYTSYKAVCGVAEDYDYIDEAFYSYIDQIRVRPLRLQIQYNSWFDFLTRVNKENFKSSVQKIHHELVEKRKLKPRLMLLTMAGKIVKDLSQTGPTSSGKSMINFQKILPIVCPR